MNDANKRPVMSRLLSISLKTMLRSLPSLILLLLLFANAACALRSVAAQKEESGPAKAVIEKKEDLSGVGEKKPDPQGTAPAGIGVDPGKEETDDEDDDDDDETEEKADLSNNGKEESNSADPAIVRKAELRKAEFGVATEWEQYKWKDGDRDQIFLLTPMYRPTKNLGFSVEIPYAVNGTPEETTRGIGDVTFGGNYVFLWDDYENDDPLLTLEGSIMLDSGSFSKGLGKGSNEYTLMPTVSKRVFESLVVSGQVGYTFVVNGEEERKNYVPYGIDLDWTVSDGIHIIGGFTSDQHPDITKPDQKVAELGLSYEILDWLTVSASYKKGVTRESPQWGMSVGITIEYPGAD